MKNDLWVGIAHRVSEVGNAYRTVKEVKTKWENLPRKSKAQNQTFKKSLTQTGGGPPVQSPQGVFKEIIDLNQDNESFQGIDGGIETGLNGAIDDDSCEGSCETLNNARDDEEAVIRQPEIGTGRITSACGLQIIHPVDVDVDVEITNTVKEKKEDITMPEPRKKRQRITQEMVWEAQLQFFKEQTLTERRRRQLMDTKEEFYKAATAAIHDGSMGNIVHDIFPCLKET